MTDVKIKKDKDGNVDQPSLETVNKKLEAFVEILTGKFQEQHDRIRLLENAVKELRALVVKAGLHK
jgi:hypothetical protein